MKLINLTPTAVTLSDGTVLPPDPRGPARLVTDPGPTAYDIDGLSVRQPGWNPRIMGLPAEEDDEETVYLVERHVGPGVSGRNDVLILGEDGELEEPLRLDPAAYRLGGPVGVAK